MNEEARQPAGELVLRTLAMPADTNPHGDIFGGWIMSQMDLGGGMYAKEVAAGRVVTVTVQAMTFVRPVRVGEAVCVYAELQRIGNTSMDISLECWTQGVLSSGQAARNLVTHGVFRYVAIDAHGRPRPVRHRT